jgi:2-oxoacid:acceptor oxidoreductase delta subunit (pyruvate/2-ketoisovalerate family)
MKKRYSTETLEDLPITALSFLSTEANETGEWRSQRPIINSERCNQCGLCWMYCPDNAIRREGDSYQVCYRYCKGCGICATECPKKAVTFIAEER